MSSVPPTRPPFSARGADPAPFQWMPAGVAFFRRQAWPIIGCAVAGVLLGGLYMATATPQYTAVATVVIDTRAAHPVGNERVAGDFQSESSFVESQMELMRSSATLRGVVQQLHLDTSPMFVADKPGAVGRLIAAIKSTIPGADAGNAGLDAAARAQDEAVTGLSHVIVVSRVGTTSVLEVGARTPDRALSAEIANAVTEAYMAQQLVAISETTRRAGTWLQSRIGELRGQAVAADRAVQEYKAAHNIVDVQTSSGTGLMNEQALGDLTQQVSAAQSRVADMKARYERAKSTTIDGVTEGLDADMMRDTVLANMRQQYADAVRRETDLKARMGPTHGAVILQHAQVQELAQNIQAELGRLTQSYLGDYQVAQANLQGIQAKLNDQVRAAAQTNIERSELRSLQSSAESYRQIYENFLRRFTQAMQDQSYPISDARVAAPAVPPMNRSAPRTAIVMAVALTLGMALGVAIAVAREAMDATLRNAAQLREATGLDFLGAVPQVSALVARRDRRWKRAARRGELLVPEGFRQAAINPDSAIAEAVHAVRVAAARQSARGREVRVIGCVSALAEEGTSTFAANLAVAMAADGQRVVLVDGNAKAPWLTTLLTPGNKAGVQELAAHEAMPQDVEHVDPETKLRFIGQSVAEKRMQPRDIQLRAMLSDLRDLHDVVVLDLPPMQSGGTAVRLSDLVDGFVLVTRWGSTTQTVLAEALSRTAAMDALFLGAVLSRCNARRMRLYANLNAGQMVRALALTADA